MFADPLIAGPDLQHTTTSQMKLSVDQTTSSQTDILR